MAYMGFNALKNKLSHQPGIKSPGGLAASIGREKYGKKKFQKAAAKGESMEQYAARRQKELRNKRK